MAAWTQETGQEGPCKSRYGLLRLPETLSLKSLKGQFVLPPCKQKQAHTWQGPGLHYIQQGSQVWQVLSVEFEGLGAEPGVACDVSGLTA
jgi:hypothetical protein